MSVLEAGQQLGGAAAARQLVANVGEPDDYDEWERAYGCAGWGWRDVKRWFRRTRVPTRRSRRSEIGPLSQAVLTSTPGAQRARLTLTSPRDFTVQTDARVESVLLDGRRAVGVQLADGATIDASIVVVSAGALQSPTLLLRSGVDCEGIGENLHDHPSITLPVASDAPRTSGTLPISVVVRATHVDRNDIQVIPYETVEGSALLVGAMRPRSDALLEGGISVARRIAQDAGVEVAAAEAGRYEHAAGSCRMGAVSDPMAVVDNRCRVIGYDSLVVCDASVIPNLPRANPFLTTVMIAERVAAWLDDELRESSRRQRTR